MTVPNMMPTRGTMTTSLNWMCWINHTKTQVPKTAAAKAKIARPHRVELGMNNKANRMPNWAEEIVAPVVGETNLFMQSCCMIRPATLMPTPVQRIANNRGRREMRKILSCSALPACRLAIFKSITPTNKEKTDKISNMRASVMVSKCFLIVRSLLGVRFN